MKLILILLTMLTSCGYTKPSPEAFEEEYGIGGGVVRVFRLKDGTRCVSYSGGGRAITCDWKPEARGTYSIDQPELSRNPAAPVASYQADPATEHGLSTYADPKLNALGYGVTNNPVLLPGYYSSDDGTCKCRCKCTEKDSINPFCNEPGVGELLK